MDGGRSRVSQSTSGREGPSREGARGGPPSPTGTGSDHGGAGPSPVPRRGWAAARSPGGVSVEPVCRWQTGEGPPCFPPSKTRGGRLTHLPASLGVVLPDDVLLRGAMVAVRVRRRRRRPPRRLATSGPRSGGGEVPASAAATPAAAALAPATRITWPPREAPRPTCRPPAPESGRLQTCFVRATAAWPESRRTPLESI